MRPIAVLGNLSLDTIGGRAPRPGGGPFYAARALRVLARPGRLVVKCAEPDRPRFVRPLAALGLPIGWRSARSTAAFSFRYHGAHREMQVDSLGDSWEPEDVDGAELRGVDWVHVAPLLRSDFPKETLAVLARDRRVCLDGQGLVRAPRTGRLELDADFDHAVLDHLTVLKLAEEEAGALLGAVDERSVANLGIPEVLVTHGPIGSILFTGGHAEEIRAREVIGVDPTGAGDAFATAYVAARSDGLAPAAAARRATALVAALLTERARAGTHHGRR